MKEVECNGNKAESKMQKARGQGKEVGCSRQQAGGQL